MKILWALAKNSFLEFLREKLVWISFFLAIFLFLFSLVLGTLSIDEQTRILAHFGLTAVYLSGLSLASFLGSFVINREVERQTCLIVLSRPVSRSQFLLGKFFGVALLIFLVMVLLAAPLQLMLAGAFPIWNFFEVWLGVFFEIMILLAVSFFAASLTRPSIAAFMTWVVFLTGHWVQEMQFFLNKTKEPFYLWFGKVFEYGLPNLFRMNWRSTYFLEQGVPSESLFWAAAHSTGWVLILLSFAVWIFNRRELV